MSPLEEVAKQLWKISLSLITIGNAAPTSDEYMKELLLLAENVLVKRISNSQYLLPEVVNPSCPHRSWAH